MLLIRWNQYAPLIVTVVTCLPSMAFANSHYDGSYVGTMECDQIPGYTRGPLKTAFVLSVAGGRAQYERRHVLPPTGLGPAERGAGTVSSTGNVSLTGEAGDLMGGYEATYHGKSRASSSAFRGFKSGCCLTKLPTNGPAPSLCLDLSS